MKCPKCNSKDTERIVFLTDNDVEVNNNEVYNLLL